MANTLPTANPNATMQTQGLNTAPAAVTSAPQPVSTAQPTPTNTNTQLQPQTGDAQVLANQQAAAKLGVAIPGVGGTITSDAQATAAKYAQGLATANASGKTAPTTPGAGSAAVNDINSATNQAQQQQQANTDQIGKITSTLQSDPGIQQLMDDQKAYLSSQNQQETLTQQYSDLSDKLGLPALNTQLVNMKSIMDGTEQDIRNEITAAGGFATNSQVMALSSARNQVMIQNYNNLLQTRDNAETQLNTMIGLAKDDQASASQLLNEKLNYDQQIVDYGQKMTANAQSALTSMQQTEGWDGIYKAALASGDPSAIERINQTMGPGFDIASMAEADAQQRQAQQQQQTQQQAQAQATLANTKATTANTQANTQKTNAETAQIGSTTVANPKLANQPGYDATGLKYTPATAADEVRATIKSSGLTGSRNLLAPNDYNYLKSWWVQNGLTDASFDSVFGGMKDPSLATKHVYN